jgi:hypothetical protein
MMIDSDVCMLGCATLCVRTCRLSRNDIGRKGAGSLATSLCVLTGLTTLEYVYAYAWSRVRRQWNVGSVRVLLCERLWESMLAREGLSGDALFFDCRTSV